MEICRPPNRRRLKSKFYFLNRIKITLTVSVNAIRAVLNGHGNNNKKTTTRMRKKAKYIECLFCFPSKNCEKLYFVMSF